MSAIAILTASAGLGTYVPGVHLLRFLQRRRISARLDVFERLYEPEKIDQLLASRVRFQQDLSYALLAKRLLGFRSLTANVSAPRLQALFERWQAMGVRQFICLSGFWLPLLDRYQERLDTAIDVDCVQMEVVRSPSWMAHLEAFQSAHRLVWLFSLEQKRVVETLVPAETPVARTAAHSRLIVHGGGWRIGNASPIVAPLLAAGYDVLSAWPGARPPGTTDHLTTFQIDPRWESWHEDVDDYPWMQIHALEKPVDVSRGQNHWLAEQALQSLAIVSKPGGATLLDSLSSATPLVLLPAYGPTEEKNGQLWKGMGFAIDFEEWRQEGFAPNVLIPLHRRLARLQATLPSYAEAIRS